MCNVSIVIGSWGSYNEGNEKALGSKWMDLSEYQDWDDIEEELKKQGFELDGIDEELFIQDIEGISSTSANWDSMHPKTLFEKLYESDILDDNYKYDVFVAYMEVYSLSDFFNLVDSYGSNWDNDINFYKSYSWEDYGREMFDMMCYNIDEHLLDFFDFEAYGKYIGDSVHEVEDGLLEVR